MRTPRPPSRPPDPPDPDVPARDTSLPDPPAPADEPTKKKADTSALGQIEQHAITQLILTMPSTVIDPSRPMVPLPMLDLRERLLRGKVSQQAKDRAWRHLAELARTERGDWNLFALGTAYPLLRKHANKLKDETTGADRNERHFAITREFLFALHRLDLEGHHVFNRLIDAAYTHASGRKRRPKAWTAELDTAEDRQAADDTEAQAEANENTKRTPRQVLDEVIIRANSTPGRQRITDVQAALIARTYLDRELLRDVGAEYGLSEPSASKQRRRAANTIARLLGRPGLADPPEQARTRPAAS